MACLASPAFGIITHAQGDDIPFDIFVDDPDISLPTTQDKLTARLFFFDQPTMKMNRANGDDYAFDAPLDPSDPSLRHASFTASGLCAARSGTALLFIVVADRPFSTTDPSVVVKGGGSDSNYWVLMCN